MLLPKTSPLTLLQSTAYFAAITASAAVASRILAELAPTRVVEIYLVAVLGFIVAATSWVLGRRIPRTRFALFVAALLLTSGLLAGGYLAVKRNLDTKFPPVAKFIDIDAARPGNDETAPARQSGLLAILRETPGFRLRLFDLLNAPVPQEEVLSKAAELVQSRYQLLTYDSVQLPPSLTWDENPHQDRSWNWALHNMDYVVTLTRAYEATNDAAFLQRAEDIALDWIDVNTKYFLKPPSEFSWGDHTTALRLLNWLYFFDVWKGSELATPEHVETIFRALLGHAQMLSDANFYNDNHNHGIDQDRALLAFSLMFPNTARSAQWMGLALSRLSSQVQFAVSPNGIHLEHSAGYQLYGMLQLQKTHSFLQQWQVHHGVVDSMTRNIALMADYVPNLVKPDGFLVKIGDTANARITGFREQLSLVEAAPPALRDLAENGTTNKLANISLAFPAEGYALIRDFENGLRDFQKSFYLFFSAAAHQGRAHRHADDLSFVMSHGGREILIDPGMHSYKRGDPGRAYVVSAAAHNSVIVDGKSYQGWDTSFDGYFANDRLTLIRGSHRNYPGFEHLRWLLYLRPAMLIVLDRVRPISGSKTNADVPFEQVFHFSSKLTVTLDEAEGRATVLSDTSDQEAVLLLTQVGPQKGSMRVAKGEESPMQGWDSPARAQLVPTPTLVSLQRGAQAEFVTVLQIPATGQSLDELEEIRRSLQGSIEAQSFRIDWTEGNSPHKLKLDLSTNGVLID